MSILIVIASYCITWGIVFYMINPLWQTSQSEHGEVAPGTPASAPVDAMVRKKAIITTVIATVLFALGSAIFQFGWITLDDISFLVPPSQR